MERKEIQEQRMRGYFIEATREILKGEGLKSVNVRAVAERAGYSYATMYNYFKDIKELVFICVQGFQEECEAQVTAAAVKHKHGRDRIRAIMKSYMGYFVQYPGVFELFFLEKMSTISGKQPVSELIYNFTDRLCADDWQYCIDHKTYTPAKVAILKRELNAMAAGMLLFYLNRMHPGSYKEFTEQVEEQLDHLLSA
jgi:AcrR family transcriptional regulator